MYGLSGMHEFESAIKSLKCAIFKELDIYEYSNNLGRAYFKARDYDSAASMFSKAAEVNPTDSAVYMNLGAALGNVKEYDRSVASYLKAIELNPLEPRAYYELAIVYIQAGTMD